STASFGFEELLATLVLSRISMAVPAGNSAADRLQNRQKRAAMHFMIKNSRLSAAGFTRAAITARRFVLTLILSPFCFKESITHGWNFWNPAACVLMRLVRHSLSRIGSDQNRHHQFATSRSRVGRNQESVR